MNNGKYVFSQVMTYFLRWVFKAAVEKYNGTSMQRTSTATVIVFICVWPTGLMHVNQAFFVTRAKNTMKCEVVDTNYNINDLVGIVGDRTVHLAGYVSEKKYREDMRLIEFDDVDKEEVFSFLTNNFELGPLVIANIYRNRWQIETFFKWIKGSQTIKVLWGYSESAVKVHLWVAISSYLLLTWVKAALKSVWKLRSLPRLTYSNCWIFQSYSIKMSLNLD